MIRIYLDWNIFVHNWIGSGNIDPILGTFLLNVDSRFPRQTMPSFPGTTLAPSASTSFAFNIAIPAGVQKTNYLGNSCLMQFNWHDRGLYLDRSVFVFNVV
jgi:hypothetical protein